jgi:hypothetical protein
MKTTMATKGRGSDLKILRALVRHTDDLDDGEADAFTGMFDRLDSGRISSLSSAQREWAERVYYKLGLDREEPSENLVSTGQLKVTEEERQSLQAFLSTLGPRPLKPPGRRA